MNADAISAQNEAWAKVYEGIAKLEARLTQANRLLDEVRGNFTRDDDLPDNLLERIDTHLEGRMKSPASERPQPPLPDANLYAHELLSNGGGIWLACASEAILRQAHDPEETGEEIRALYTAEQVHAIILADRTTSFTARDFTDD